MTERARSRGLEDISLLFPIAGSHIRRLGWGRTLLGGGAMYLGVPILVVLHLTVAVALFQLLVRHLLGLPRLRWADHVVIDRHRIAGLSALDKLNCMFCGYANGLSTLINRELDQLDELDVTRLGIARRLAFCALMSLAAPLIAIGELHFQLIYNLLVSRPLGMLRVTWRETEDALNARDFAGGLPFPTSRLVRASKNVMIRFAMGLEQIESAWCPLAHLERREGIVYPDHHRHFFGPDQIEAMRTVLATVGTVSPREALPANHALAKDQVGKRSM